MNKTRTFKTKDWNFCGYVAIVTRGKALTEIEIMNWGGLPQTIGCVKNNKCGNALDCIRAINSVIGKSLTWEIV